MFYLEAFGMWNEGAEMSPRHLRWNTYFKGYFYNSNRESMHRGPPVKPSFNVDLDILWALFPSEIKLMNRTKFIWFNFFPHNI